MPEIDPNDTHLKRLVASVMACIEFDPESCTVLIRRPDVLHKAFSQALDDNDDEGRDALIQRTLETLAIARFHQVSDDVSSLLRRTLHSARMRRK